MFYRIHFIGKDGLPIDSRMIPGERDARAAYNEAARAYKFGWLKPEIVEVALYSADDIDDIEMLASASKEGFDHA